MDVFSARAHLDCVRSVAWAADMGRSYQLIATGSRDTTVKLWMLQRGGGEAIPSAGEAAAEGGAADEGGADLWRAACCAELAHRSQVWRVAWNAAGSMLASSEDDGTVHVFQMDSAGGWRHAQPVPVPVPVE